MLGNILSPDREQIASLTRIGKTLRHSRGEILAIIEVLVSSIYLPPNCGYAK